MIDNKQVWDKGLGPATGMIFNQGSSGSSASQQMSPMQTQTGQTGQQDWNKYNVQKSVTNYNPDAMSGSTPVDTSQTQTPSATPTPTKPSTPAAPAQGTNSAPKFKANPYQKEIDRYNGELQMALMKLNQYKTLGPAAVGNVPLSQLNMAVAKAQQKIMEFTNAGKKWM